MRRGSDEHMAVQALILAVQANNESIRHLAERIDTRLDAIDGHLSVLIDTVADHIANHGDV